MRDALLGLLDVRDAMDREVAEAFMQAPSGRPLPPPQGLEPRIMEFIRQANRLEILVNQATAEQIHEDVNQFIAWCQSPVIETDELGADSVTTPIPLLDFARRTLKELPLASLGLGIKAMLAPKVRPHRSTRPERVT